MHRVTTFDSSAVTGRQVNEVVGESLALERARIYRRLFVTRFGLLGSLIAAAGFGVHWLPLFGVWVSVGACAVAPMWAWIAELRCRRRLDRRLQVLSLLGHVALRKKVVKSS